MRFSMGSRRGSYAALYALTAAAFIGFGAIAVDISMLRLADAEIQAVADAAAQAGVLELRRSDDRAVAKTVADQTIARNRVAGIEPKGDAVEFGIFQAGTFSTNGLQANAVNIDVSATLSLPFASFWGDGARTVRASATAAARALHTVVVVDITNSWSVSNFLNARDGALAVFDQVTAAASNADRIGMVLFYGKYGVIYTDLMLVKDAVAANVRADWDLIRPASLESQCPGGGKCAPQMPRQYEGSPCDECGTDHAIGMLAATKLFAKYPDPSVYRAMIVVTDGQPANVGPHQVRVLDPSLWETRWPIEYTGLVARTIPQIEAETVNFAQAAWTNAEVHTWFVSFLQDAQFMRNAAQGDGYFIRATNSADLVTIFRDIAESLPITLVE